MASRSQRVELVVRAAWRRSIALLCLEQAAIAVSFVFAGCALILLLGTQLLNWYWLVLLGFIGTAAGVVRVWRRLPSAYGTAQTLDMRLHLSDSISTAWHVNETPGLSDTAAGQIQLSQAEALAQEIDPARVFPVKLPRSWALALALVALVLSLFSVRYLVQRNMSLSRSLVPLHLDSLTAALRNEIGEVGKDDSQREATGNRGNDTRESARNESGDPRMNDVLGMKNPIEAPSKEGGAQGSTMQGKNTGDGNSTESGKTPGGNNSSDSESGQLSKSSSKDAAKNDHNGEQPQASEESDNESLMNRMKDVVSSMMAKMKPDTASHSQSSSQNSAAPDQDQTQNENGQSQSQTSASQSAQAQSKSDSKSSAQAQATEMSQSGDSRNTGSSENKDGNQSKSGVGKQDGAKEVKLAHEQEAMGKLAEIIGKRSRDVSGEMMVEVPSGRQQLRTSYTGEVAQHSDTGGEINRDEIPVALQPYVREYMERVRQEAGNKK